MVSFEGGRTMYCDYYGSWFDTEDARANTKLAAFLSIESIYRHHMEVKGQYISLDIMDTAGEVKLNTFS